MGYSKKNTPFKRVLDELERKHLNFDGEGFTEEYHDYMDGSEATPHTGSMTTKLYQADPYQIIVENKHQSNALTVRLFGNDKFLLKSNFGNSSALSITTGQSGVEYVELLQQSSTKPFSTQFMRIESENKLQLTKFITVNQKDANGNWFRRPMNMQQFKSAYQQQETMLDAPINEDVDGSTYWEIEIEPLTRVFYTIFPMYKVDNSSSLKGQGTIKHYGQARVNTSGLQMPPNRSLKGQ